MITSKQRAKLRSMAQTIQPIVHIGKDGITENLVRQAALQRGDQRRDDLTCICVRIGDARSA